jgi:hypothetical protein
MPLSPHQGNDQYLPHHRPGRCYNNHPDGSIAPASFPSIVYPAGAGGLVLYTHESRSDILDKLPQAGPDLGYMPVGEQVDQRDRWLLRRLSIPLRAASGSFVFE